jgi:hypothetical protein
VIVAAGDRFHALTSGALLDEGTVLKAWVERHVRQDPDIRWVLGNYVEADQANSNGHIFPLDELTAASSTLAGKPLNMMHREHYIVGAFAGAQLLNADGSEYGAGPMAHLAAALTLPNTATLEYRPVTSTSADFTLTAAGQPQPPYVEALAGLWHYRFPEEFYNIKKAHAEGTLFFSMEAIPEEVSCPECSHRAAYAGFSHDSYCEHMNGVTASKVLHKPTFNGGAIIIPPVRPGWSRADITTISEYVAAHQEEAEAVHDAVAEAAPHLGADEWERTMTHILTLAARDVPPKEREKLAQQNKAMPDGSFPIANEKDLRNAIQAIGRAKNPGAVKSHIRRRARALGLEDLIPDGW